MPLVHFCYIVKFIYSEKATKFCEIFPLLLTVCNVVKRKGKISQNVVAFSEYMNFTKKRRRIKDCSLLSATMANHQLSNDQFPD